MNYFFLGSPFMAAVGSLQSYILLISVNFFILLVVVPMHSHFC